MILHRTASTQEALGLVSDLDHWSKSIARRPTGYIPTPANANFVGVMRCVASWKSCILRPGGQGVKIPLAVMLWKLVKHGILMEFYDAKHFRILRTLLGIVWNHLITPITRTTEIDRTIFCQKSITSHFK